MPSACSRVGSEASTSTCAGPYCWPSTTTSFGCSLSLPLANSLIRRPAAPGSSVENAYRRGPTIASLATAKSVPSTARAASVFLTTFKYTPVSRAFLRIAVICSTVVPAYSAAIRECALAATSATSATTFCFWDRLRAISLLQLNSARGSSRWRSWAAPILGAGDAGHPGAGHPEVLNQHSRRASPSTQARSIEGCGLSDPAFGNGDSMPCEHPCPSLPCADRTCGL